MSSLFVIIVLGLMLIVAGLYNLGMKARKLERTDDVFLQRQLSLAKQECYSISKQFSIQLAKERKMYLNGNSRTNNGYNEWMTKGVERFFRSEISPKLVDAQRECLIQYGAYTEIIDQVASIAQEEAYS